MRKFLLTILSLVAFTAAAQDVVQWKQEVKDNGNGNYTLVVKAVIDEGWHIYDATHSITPTTIEFTPSEGVTLEGSLRALSTAKPVSDEFFGDYGEYEGEALYEQDVTLKGEGGTVTALVYFFFYLFYLLRQNFIKTFIFVAKFCCYFLRRYFRLAYFFKCFCLFYYHIIFNIFFIKLIIISNMLNNLTITF